MSLLLGRMVRPTSPEGVFMFTVDQPVSTEWGNGKVEDLSSRRIVIALDNGDRLNIVTGTPGYDRILAL